jgi:hypothetical protein
MRKLYHTPFDACSRANDVECERLREDDMIEFLMEYGPRVRVY